MEASDKHQIRRNLKRYWAKAISDKKDMLMMFEHPINDGSFWKDILSKYSTFEADAIVSRMESGENEFIATGSKEVLKYLEVYEKFKTTDLKDIKIAFCIDSDYRYLLEDNFKKKKKYVWQTFTYSYEVHSCYAKTLNTLLSNHYQVKKTDFDFEIFLPNYSKVIYEVLLYWLFFQKNSELGNENSQKILSWKNLSEKIGVKKGVEVDNGNNYNAKIEIERIEKNVVEICHKLKQLFPDIDITIFRSDLENKFELNAENAYLYLLQGHILFDSVKHLFESILDKYRYNEEITKKTSDKKNIGKNLDKQKGQKSYITLLGVNYKDAGNEKLMQKLVKQIVDFA